MKTKELEQGGIYILKHTNTLFKAEVLEVTKNTYHIKNLDRDATFRTLKTDFTNKYIVVEFVKRGLKMMLEDMGLILLRRNM